jgi:fused signal recognition particle receptor
MANEKTGFWRRLYESDVQDLFGRGRHPTEPAQEELERDRCSREQAHPKAQPHPDVEIETQEGPGPDAHRPAAASVDTDTEAGPAPEQPVSRVEPMRAAPSAEDAGKPIPVEDLDQDPSQSAAAPPPLEPAPAPADSPAPSEARLNWFQRLRGGLSKSSNAIVGGIAGVFTKQFLDADQLHDLEDVLIQADLGVPTATAIIDALAGERFARGADERGVREVLANEVEKVLGPVARPLEIDLSRKPFVILVVGVNGTGKTTTIGKLAAKLRAEGRSVMLAAGDTFRAAAIEQLQIWGERTGSPVVARQQGADAAGLAFDAMVEARKAETDVLIVDTAGRLQNRAELMAELEKVIRVMRKHDPAAPHAVLLTLDATTGQNALAQVEVFREKAGVTGLVMTKLDGTARGGILVAIAEKYGLPVHFIGVGEKVEDLQPFAARDFARAIAGLNGAADSQP